MSVILQSTTIRGCRTGLLLPKQYDPNRRVQQLAGGNTTTFRQFARSSWLSPSIPTAASSNDGGGNGTSVTGPSKSLKSWESGARMIKNAKVENEYMDHLRDLHDPSLHVKTIEDELKGTIGKALGKQGEKVLRFLNLMKDERQRYEELVSSQQQQDKLSSSPSRSSSLIECAKKHNGYRANAIQARWELTVHRQAVGFVVNNHKFVQENFPIPEKLPELDDTETNGNKNVETPKKKQFTDQLDWWQRIGRWK